MFKRYLSTLFLTLLLPITGFPHEYWFEPSTFFPSVNEKIDIRLYAGEALKREEERTFQKEKTTSFMQFFGKAWFDIGKDNADNSLPFYNFTSGSPGNHLFAMERNWSHIILEPKDFDDYLREDGMEYIMDERAKLGESQKAGRERYSRFIKTLLQIGEKRDASYKAKTVLKLDITPLENPYSKKVGDTIGFRVLFNGKPLANRTAFADNRDGETFAKQKLITDANGKFTIKLDRKGTWLVRLVFMQRCKADCGEADWESFWGAFSFGVR